MPVYRDEGIVLHTHKLGEADRIITLLTRERGKVRVVAKGVRRTTSRIGARLEPFMHVDFQCYEGRSLDTVTQVVTIAASARQVIADFDLYTAAAAILEAADRIVAHEREPATQQFLLLSGALRAIATRAHASGLVLDSYLLRALAIAGYAPSFVACARCGAPGPHTAFSAVMGGAVCPQCRPPGSASPSPETMTLLAALLAGDWPVADASSGRHRREASGIVSVYCQFHLERSLRSLRLVDRSDSAMGTSVHLSDQSPAIPDDESPLLASGHPGPGYSSHSR